MQTELLRKFAQNIGVAEQTYPEVFQICFRGNRRSLTTSQRSPY